MRRLLVLAGIALLPLSAWADTLILRDGAQHTGRFISGSGNTILFQDDNGRRQSYNLSDVQSIQFESGRSGAMNNRGRYNTDGQTISSASPVRNANVNMSAARTIPAGTNIVVRSNEAIDSTSASEGQTFPASVSQDIVDTAGNVVVPRGSEAELVVRNANSGGTTGSPDLVLDLQSLKVGNQRYLVSSTPVTETNNQGLGKNKRTAEMVGGGALLGTLIGAVAGGGKGAAIGAVAGAAAGAGAQVLTRGKEVKVPAETQLTFSLQQPIKLVPEQR